MSNSRYMVAGITGIVVGMSIFTWLMWGIANRIDTMTITIVNLGSDIRAMTEFQKTMGQDIGSMSQSISSIEGTVANMNGQIHAMSQNVALMTGSTANMTANMARMSHDVGRSSQQVSSPMAYFWNMGK
ncbi:MAG: hypothetical protein HQL36_10865 [Alphaproteobacteria bacterium]|nr:hypothetical protein [Alphaproteobacteria bacterium]